MGKLIWLISVIVALVLLILTPPANAGRLITVLMANPDKAECEERKKRTGDTGVNCNLISESAYIDTGDVWNCIANSIYTPVCVVPRPEEFIVRDGIKWYRGDVHNIPPIPLPVVRKF